MTVAAAPVGPQRYAETYPATEMSATQARHDVSLILATWRLEQLVESAELIVTELMANAIQHGGGPIGLSITRLLDGARIAVSDGCQDRPSTRPADSLDEGGRGLLLVDALADSWGCEPTPTGKRMWVELLSVAGS